MFVAYYNYTNHQHFSYFFQRDAAHNPLTFDEKKTLIAQIHKLPSDKMPHVLNIIQSALPPRENEEDGDIEVPLDALDTFTLRKLQKFIEVQNLLSFLFYIIPTCNAYIPSFLLLTCRRTMRKRNALLLPHSEAQPEEEVDVTPMTAHSPRRRLERALALVNLTLCLP